MSIVDLAPPHESAADESRADEGRAARARAALALAEQQTGVRRTASDLAWARGWEASAASTTGPAFAPAPVRPGGPGARPDEAPDLVTEASESLPVAAEVRDLLPGRALRRGTVLSVTGSTTLLLSLVAQASRDGAWAVAVGMPRLGVVAAEEAGVALDRLALVPRPGPDAPATIAALIDGMDLVLVGPGAVLTDADRRRLVARARDRGAVLLATTPWAGSHVTLDVAAVRWSGTRAGTGWLRRQHLSVSRGGRSGVSPSRAEVVLPLGLGSGPVAWEGGGEVAGIDDARQATSPAHPHLRLVGRAS